ncbi:MAG: FAD-dependent thymidylate synthase [Clostridiales bacterium]|nr:FAD-dependent thymidylate synthase [Clostridiales bacterium]
MSKEFKSAATIIGVSDCGEKCCGIGSRISHQDGDVIDIWEKSQDAEKNANLIPKIMRSGHTSTIEHMMFNIAFQNVSVVVEQFIIEFRLASFTVKSRRYVDFSNSGYFVPDFENNEYSEKYKEHMDKLFSTYQKLTEMGVPKEDARFVLPYCFYSNFICSVNARELLHMLKAMLFGRGSKYPEIKALGEQIYEQAKKHAPGVFSYVETFEKEQKDFIDLKEFETEKPYPLTAQSKFIRLLSSTSDAHKVIAKTALTFETTLTDREIDTILNDDENIDKIIKAVANSSRPRPLEFASYTFKLYNVSLSCITHIVRHRMQSIVIPSLTLANRRRYITPPCIEEKRELKAIYDEAFNSTAELYDELKKDGVSEENLVYCLLSGNTLDIVLNMNARELRLFLSLRTCNRAQWETREYATEMLKTLRNTCPLVFKYFGPSCVVEGKCPEGKLSCGKMAEMQKKFHS